MNKPLGVLKIEMPFDKDMSYEKIFKNGVNDESFEEATRFFFFKISMEEFRREWMRCSSQTGMIIRDSNGEYNATNHRIL